MPSLIRALRRYELEISPDDGMGGPVSSVLRRGRAHEKLTELVGLGDAWAFLDAADRDFDTGRTGWAVEYQPPSRPGS